jgi:hypothetical protein
MKKKDYLEDQGVDGIRKVSCENVGWIHLPQDRKQWLGSREHGNEPSSGSVERGKYLGRPSK